MKSKRRKLVLQSAEEVIDEVNRLRRTGYKRLGNWNLAQACEHLDKTMTRGMEGFGFRLPWILRATVFAWAFRYSLKKQKIGAGAPTFRVLRPSSEPDQDDSQVIDAFIKTCRRAASFEGPLENYPLLNDPPVEDWRRFMWIHAAHHLSFLIPKAPAD